jgi:hypothetical protein
MRSGVAVQRNDVKLLPGERVERVQELEIVDPPARPDPLDELWRLARVERPEEVGLNGPLIAARATDGNAGEAALRLFEIVYGRDSLVAALFVGDLFPLLREATVLCLARYQGKRYDAWREEEPGRIAHMIGNPNRDAKLGYPYYGTVDATPHFISAAMHAIKARPAFEAEIRHALDGPSRGCSGGSQSTSLASSAISASLPTGLRTRSGRTVGTASRMPTGLSRTMRRP